MEKFDELCSRIRLYNTKQKLLKIKKAEEFLNLEDDVVDKYNSLISKRETLLAISIMSRLGALVQSAMGIYAASTDDYLKYDILKISQNGLKPVIDNLCDQSYIYLLSSIIVFNLIASKTSEGSNIYMMQKDALEHEIPDLKNQKYLKYIKNKN